MSRISLLLAFLACALFVALPVVPVQADLILPSEDAPKAASETPGEEAVPSSRVGAFLSGEEWWEIPLGAAALFAGGWMIYHFTVQNN